MQELLNLLWRCVRWFTPSSNAVDTESSQPSTKPRRVSVSKIEKARNAAEAGEFYFKESILDRLDCYFDAISHMRKHDRESYELYSKVGAHVMPPIFDGGSELSPWFLQTRPSFGAIALVGKDFVDADVKQNVVTPTFLCIRKYDRQYVPPQIERPHANEYPYVVTVFWIDRENRMKAAPTEFGIALDDNGRVRVLRAKIDRSVRCRSKRGPRKGIFTLHQSEWGIHPFFKSWAREHKSDVESWLVLQFKSVAATLEMANLSLTRVSVVRGIDTAVFGVSIKRMPYFFRDRDITISNATGQRRRIFHIVRPHDRNLSDGRKSIVRLHFRGERSFRWNGYGVHVTVPGRHHRHLAEFDVGLMDSERDNPERDTISMRTFAKRIQEHLAA